MTRSFKPKRASAPPTTTAQSTTHQQTVDRKTSPDCTNLATTPGDPKTNPRQTMAVAKTATSTKSAPSLEAFLHKAIRKCTRKITRHETAVKTDRDPEDLHQMRVGMRRLRTALRTYGSVLDLPKSARSAQVGKVARKLGALRDLDVLLAALEQHYWSALPLEEQRVLAGVMQQLQGNRQKAYRQAKQALKGKTYRQFKQSIRAWLRSPGYQPLAQLPVTDIVPEFIHPLICQLWLHPGWLVGTEFVGDRFVPLTNLSPETAEQLVSQRGTPLHDLRKAIKQVRYQLDFYSEWLGKDCQLEVKGLAALQDCLGGIQDSVVLEDVLDRLLGSTLARQMPTMASILVQSRHRAWLDWQPLQNHYLQADARRTIHQILMTRS